MRLISETCYCRVCIEVKRGGVILRGLFQLEKI